MLKSLLSPLLNLQDLTHEAVYQTEDASASQNPSSPQSDQMKDFMEELKGSERTVERIGVRTCYFTYFSVTLNGVDFATDPRHDERTSSCFGRVSRIRRISCIDSRPIDSPYRHASCIDKFMDHAGYPSMHAVGIHDCFQGLGRSSAESGFLSGTCNALLHIFRLHLPGFRNLLGILFFRMRVRLYSSIKLPLRRHWGAFYRSHSTISD